MSGLWFTKEQIEAEKNMGRFNSPWDERSFRSRILQDWLTMYEEITALKERNEAILNDTERISTKINIAEATIDTLRSELSRVHHEKEDALDRLSEASQFGRWER